MMKIHSLPTLLTWAALIAVATWCQTSSSRAQPPPDNTVPPTGVDSPTNLDSPTGAGPPSTQALKTDVLEWVDQLDAPSLVTRREAERHLIKAGPAALDFLPETKPGFSVEAAERLSRVRKTLMAIRTETEIKAESATVRLDDVSNLGEALEAISRDSGVEFEHRADESVAIAPVETPLPFWHALDLVLDQAGLDINFYGGGHGTLALEPRREGRPSRVDSAAYAGVYRIEPTSVTSRRSLRNPNLSGLNIGIEISWEPQVTPIGLTIPVQQLSGRLDDQAKLQPQESGDTIDIAANSEIAFTEFFVPMQLPAGQPAKIESLSGVIRGLLPGRRQSFELPLAQPGATKTIDAMTVQVESVRKNGPLHEVRLRVELQDADRSLESHRHWVYENQIHIQRKDGSRADHLGFEVFRQTESSVGIGYLFDLGDSAQESTLFYQSPTAVVPNEVSFVIQDIPLP